MRSFRSMKYQIAAAAALLLSGPYITSAADPADEIQWSESVPVDEERNPGERIEAYIVDGLLHARRLDLNDIPLWHLILAEADPDQPPTLEHLGAGSIVEVRHVNGAYFVRDTWRFPSALLAAHRQQLSPETFASLDITVRQNGIDITGLSYSSKLTPAMLQQHPPEVFASYDSTALADLVQEFAPEAFASFDTASFAVIKKQVPEAFANPDTTVRQSSPPPSFQRGITKWEKIAVDASASAQRYGIWSFPQSVLLDRDCRIAWLSQDGETPSPAQLKHLLDNIDTFPAH